MEERTLRNSQPRSRLIDCLSDAERDRITPHLQRVNLENGQTLLEAGSPIEAIWFPRDCITSTIVDTPEGTTIEVGLMGSEGVVGISLLLGQAISNTTVIVQVPGTADRMRTADVLAYIIKPGGEARNLLLRYTDSFMALVAQTAACNSLHGVQQRLARWILLTHDRIGRGALPLTQEFLSYMLGVRRPSVSIAASELQMTGVIRYSRGLVEVLDRKRLEEGTCACYGIVRNMTERLYENCR